MYFAAKRTILFREEHSPRVLVDKVDFISAPGWSPPEVARRGGPVALLTGKALFSWKKDARRFCLESAHPGHTAGEVREHTGFQYEADQNSALTAGPTEKELTLLRGPVANAIGVDYPQFARRVWNAA
jgi:glutaconate CoA-transferase subunit B